MKTAKQALLAAALAIPLVLGVGIAPASASVTYNTGGRSCNSGFIAQTVAYHRQTVQHGQFTGSTWSFTNINRTTWGYSYDGRATQSFTQGTIYASNSANVSSVVSTSCS